MSDTDNTRPWSVKCLDDPSWLTARHDHTGPLGAAGCDLPARPTKTAEPFGSPETTCTWVASHDFWTSAQGRAHCSRCAGQDERKANARRSRYAGAREAREEFRGVFGSAQVVDDLADVPDLFVERDLEAEYGTDFTTCAAVAEALGIVAPSHVVHVEGRFRYLDREDWEPTEIGTAVTVMQPDGTREVLVFEESYVDFLNSRTAVGAQ